MVYDLKASFQNAAHHNQRANRQMFVVLAQLTGRARRRDSGAWFGSLHGILNHILVCDINWLRRYRALSPESPALQAPCLDPPNLSWDHDLHDDFKGFEASRVLVDDTIRAWFDDFSGAHYDRIFSYLDSVGNRREAMAGQAFEFLFLHQIHHRGQISQILDSLGLPNNWGDNAAYLEAPGG
jgi:uncharacterized damage-inducible protein DinB